MQQSSLQNRRLQRLRTRLLVGCLGAALFFLCISSVQAQPATLRRIDPVAIAARIYEQVPDLPLDNQYISSKTGQVATDNTLVSRIIRYHLYSKERPTNFRFDWKLTIADYLGAFDRISARNYASYGLRDDPMEADIAAVRSLSREERNRLTNALYNAFTMPAEVEPAANPAPDSTL